MIISELKKGGAINWKHGVWQAIDITFVNPGKGSAFYKVKLRNVETGQVVENTFKSGESLDEATVAYMNAQYLYSDGEGYHFMENDTFEQVVLTEEVLGDVTKFLKENSDVKLQTINGKASGVQLPPKIVFEIIDAPPGVKGDSATGKTIPATIDTGAIIQVPLFCKTGDKIRINTDTGEYVERAN
ncbi:MAG: elongation factor P [Candidatus Gracilibacteria bacterium]|nr:elongation factor P [Candidatus Gracilibacteria bacterium]